MYGKASGSEMPATKGYLRLELFELQLIEQQRLQFKLVLMFWDNTLSVSALRIQDNIPSLELLIHSK